ncbi:MAG: hypothetical protein QM697_13545 [Lachnospiraceae bacterium]
MKITIDHDPYYNTIIGNQQKNIRTDQFLELLNDKQSKSETTRDEYKKMETLPCEKTQTDSQIIVKADGSRVLVMAIRIAGMETTMSLEISKPTQLQNDIQNDGTQDTGDMGSDHLTEFCEYEDSLHF